MKAQIGRMKAQTTIFVAALLFGTAPLWGGTKTVQLLVVDHAAEGRCRDAPPGWDSTAAPEKATAADAAEDLRRYFGGLSAQFTHILEAAWHGRVRFCTDAEENEVLRALAVLVVRPLPQTWAAPVLGTLPSGAAELLKPLAFHESVEIDPRMLARITKRTGLKPEDI
jgi:hypothetical protein